MSADPSPDPWSDLHDPDDTIVGHRAEPVGSSAGDDTVLRPGRPVVAPGRPAANGSGRPSPRLHGVRVAGRDLLLDAPIVVGRRPTAPRVVGGVAPLLVAVPSPTHEVSASHVDVRHEGDAVVVTDLRSTNGTRVTEPGRVPVVLRQGESLVARAGTIVDVGDGNVLEILPPHRIVPTKEPFL